MRVYEKMEAEIGCNCESFILKTHISLRTIIVLETEGLCDLVL
jgi:hypothetical protein